MFASSGDAGGEGRKRPAPRSSSPRTREEGLDGATDTETATPTFGSLAKRARTSSFDARRAEELRGPHRGVLVEFETSRLSTPTDRSVRSDCAVAGADNGAEEGGRKNDDDDDDDAKAARNRLDREVEALTAAVRGWGGDDGGRGDGGNEDAGRGRDGGGWCLSGLRSWREKIVSADADAPSGSAVGSEARTRGGGVDDDGNVGRRRRALRDRRREARREVMRALRGGARGDGGVR